MNSEERERQHIQESRAQNRLLAKILVDGSYTRSGRLFYTNKQGIRFIFDDDANGWKVL